MKRQTIFIMLFTLMFSAGSLFAQKGPEMMPDRGRPAMQCPQPGERMLAKLPGLTDEQKEQIKSLHLDMMKKTLPLRNSIQEKKARLHTLQTQEAVNLKKVNALIDEIAQIKSKMAKMRAANRQKIRALLNDEQRIIFDNMPPRGKGPGKHHRRMCRK